MIFNQINLQNKSVLFVDCCGIEKCAKKIINSTLFQQNNLKRTAFLEYNDLNEGNLSNISSEIIVLPLVSEILIDNKPAFVFKLLNKLKENKNIKQVFTWVTKQNIQDDFVIPFLEYIADQIITIKNLEELCILTKRTGGLVSNKNFKYKLTKDSFEIEAVKILPISKSQSNETNLESQVTFKIDLEEEEMLARNALKLPYEKAKENEGNIIYTPDDADDFDDEDPDADLTI